MKLLFVQETSFDHRNKFTGELLLGESFQHSLEDITTRRTQFVELQAFRYICSKPKHASLLCHPFNLEIVYNKK